MVEVGKQHFKYHADKEHILILEECGLHLIFPVKVIKPVESVYEVTAQGLWGGNFVFPEGSKLISGICHISIVSSTDLNEPVTLYLQHCAEIIDEKQTQYLSFVIAKSGPIFKFEYLQGGSFSLQSEYGIISLKQFSLIGIVQSIYPMIREAGNMMRRNADAVMRAVSVVSAVAVGTSTILETGLTVAGAVAGVSAAVVAGTATAVVVATAFGVLSSLALRKNKNS